MTKTAETGKPSLRAGLSLKDDIANGILPSASSSLREDKKAAMSTLLKEMTPLSTICNVAFCNVVQEHELAAAEGLNGTEGFIPVKPPYNVQRNRKEGNAIYAGSVIEDLKDMVRAL